MEKEKVAIKAKVQAKPIKARVGNGATNRLAEAIAIKVRAKKSNQK